MMIVSTITLNFNSNKLNALNCLQRLLLAVNFNVSKSLVESEMLLSSNLNATFCGEELNVYLFSFMFKYLHHYLVS